jgi:hypothetical protein
MFILKIFIFEHVCILGKEFIQNAYKNSHALYGERRDKRKWWRW